MVEEQRRKNGKEATAAAITAWEKINRDVSRATMLTSLRRAMRSRHPLLYHRQRRSTRENSGMLTLRKNKDLQMIIYRFSPDL
jgi:hypothetical protein